MKRIALALLTLLALTGCASTRAQSNFMVVNIQGREMILAKLSETEAIYVSNPKVACMPSGTVSDGRQGPSLLMHYTEVPAKKMTVALWSQWSQPLLQQGYTLPAYAEGYGKELCRWYNKM